MIMGRPFLQEFIQDLLLGSQERCGHSASGFGDGYRLAIYGDVAPLRQRRCDLPYPAHRRLRRSRHVLMMVWSKEASSIASISPLNIAQVRLDGSSASRPCDTAWRSLTHVHGSDHGRIGRLPGT
jgi:hypothetical protein